jgi:hypothetical protein
MLFLFSALNIPVCHVVISCVLLYFHYSVIIVCLPVMDSLCIVLCFMWGCPIFLLLFTHTTGCIQKFSLCYIIASYCLVVTSLVSNNMGLISILYYFTAGSHSLPDFPEPPPPPHLSPFVEAEVEVKLRLMVSLPVCLGVRHPSGTHIEFLSFFLSFF